MSAITVERRDVDPRFAFLGAHYTATLEALEYWASCGCFCVFGVRVDNGEKTLGFQPCPTHEPYGTEFLRRFTAPDAPAIDTELWMADCLEELGP